MKTHKTIIILILSNLKLNNSIFNYMLNQPLGQAIAEFLNTESNIQKMIDASDKDRPAIEALGKEFLKFFLKMELWFLHVLEILMKNSNLM